MEHQRISEIHQNNVKPRALPGGLQLTTRRLMAEPKIWVKLMCRLAAPSCSPGDFWAKTQNFREKSIIQHMFHMVHFMQFIMR